MNIRITILCLFLFLVQVSSTVPQTDNPQKNDSLNASKLDNFNLKVKELESKRLKDSAVKETLESQILALKTTDDAKRVELQRKLQEIEDNDKNRIQELSSKIDSLRLTARSFPVMGFFKDTLFLIYNRLGSFSAAERAAAIESRIKKLASNYEFTVDSLSIISQEASVDLMSGESIILTVSESDAIWNNTSRTELAQRYKSLIADAINQYRQETSLTTLAKEIGLAILVLSIMVATIIYLRKLFRWLASRIESYEGTRIRGISVKNYTLVNAKQQVNVLLTVMSIVKWLLILLTVYIALPILFGIFPWTKHFADTLFGYILNPAEGMIVGVWNYLPNLITIVVIYIVFRYVLKGVNFLKTEIEEGNLSLSGFYPDWANPTYQILRVILYAFMFVLIFPYLPGSDSPIFQGVSVFLGVLFTFGSSGSLSNIVAGLVLTYMRLFRIGDRVKIGDVVGDVIEKSMLVTRVRTIKNEIISIPNSTVMSSHTINYSGDADEKGLILHSTVTIGYDVPWRKMHQALLTAADRTELVLKDPKPFVLQTSLDDFYVSYQINAYTSEANKQATIYSQLHCNIQDSCNEAGIEILSPHYRSERDGNMTTIPANYLDSDYRAPSFRVDVNEGEKP